MRTCFSETVASTCVYLPTWVRGEYPTTYPAAVSSNHRPEPVSDRTYLGPFVFGRPASMNLFRPVEFNRIHLGHFVRGRPASMKLFRSAEPEQTHLGHLIFGRPASIKFFCPANPCGTETERKKTPPLPLSLAPTSLLLHIPLAYMLVPS